MLHELCDESRFGKIVTADLLPLRRAVHDGLITAHNGERNWGIAHRILMPVFGPLKIRDMFPHMNDLAQQMCLKWWGYFLVLYAFSSRANKQMVGHVMVRTTKLMLATTSRGLRLIQSRSVEWATGSTAFTMGLKYILLSKA